MQQTNQDHKQVYISKVELSCGLQLALPPYAEIDHLYREIIVEDSYRLYPQSKWTESWDGQVTVIDIGAHAGLLSCLVAHLFPKSKVLAFEAHPTNHKFLEENIKVNQLEQQVTAYHLALAGEAGTRKIFSAPTPECHSTIMPEGEFYQDRLTMSGEVRCISLNEAFSLVPDESYIDLLKIDCEGAEGEMFDSASDATFDRIKRIAMEYHEDISILSPQDLIYLFKQKGFQTEIIPSKDWQYRGMIYACK
ncbi:MAG: FkbM family methyltransferase [Symploca sp. SIO2C1]|nr:FkbM family methyltransferase [Symploca sp. SIO2C1]